MRIYMNELDASSLEIAESTLFLGNGYLGVRSCFEEGYPGNYWTNQNTLINGFHEIHPIIYGEKAYGFAEENETILPVFDGQTTEIYIDGEKMLLLDEQIEMYERYLDLDKGIHVRRAKWRSKKGKEVSCIWKRLVSFSNKHIFITSIQVEGEEIEIELRTRIHLGKQVSSQAFDPRVAQEIHTLQDVIFDEQREIFVGSTEQSGMHVYTHVDISCPVEIEIDGDEIIYISREKNKAIYEKKIIYADSREHDKDSFIQLCEQEKAIDFAFYESKQEKSVTYLFRNLNNIHIDERKKDVMYHNLFSIYQSLGREDYLNIAAKGLSGLGYEGHYFWDSEMYVFPVMLKLNPELAKIMLKFRINMLPYARKRSKELGYKKGALYPWRTITGKECSAFFEAGTAQHHITGDIAYAAIQYMEKTNDKKFLAEELLEMLYECALLWLEIGFFDEENYFHIDMVTGPDEYSVLVCDNYYTNKLAEYNMKKVLEYIKFVKESKYKLSFKVNETYLKQMEMAVGHFKIYKKYGITSQDRDFLNKERLNLKQIDKGKFPLLLHYHPLFIYRYQVCKQADLILAHYLFFDETDKEQIKRDIAYYDEITTHDSSLSYSIFAILYKRLNQIEKAEEYIMKNMYLDLKNLHGNTRDGVHIASMAGTLLYLLDEVK